MLKIGRSNTLLVVLFFIQLSSIILNLKDLIGFSSSDELLYTTFFEKEFTSYLPWHYLWGVYVSFLYNLHPHLPTIISLILLYYSLYIFQLNFNLKRIWLIFLFPSVFFFSLTYLRDIPIVAFSFLFLSQINKGTKKGSFMSFIFLLLIFCLRPYFGAALFVMLILSSKRFLVLKTPTLLLVSFLIIGFLIYVNEFVGSLYSERVILMESHLPQFGMLGFDKESSGNIEAMLTFLFNWIPYWYNYSIVEMDSLVKFPFVIESTLLFSFITLIFLGFDSAKYSKLKVYRLSFLTILLSFFLASIESGNATVLRHKLVFIPFLVFLLPHSIETFRRNYKSIEPRKK